jgi:hypothetical protein
MFWTRSTSDRVTSRCAWEHDTSCNFAGAWSSDPRQRRAQQRPFSKLFGQVRNLRVGVKLTLATNRPVVVLLKANLLWANHALSVMQLLGTSKYRFVPGVNEHKKRPQPWPGPFLEANCKRIIRLAVEA